MSCLTRRWSGPLKSAAAQPQDVMPTKSTMRYIRYWRSQKRCWMSSLIFISFMLASCASQDEVSRVPSPDGRVEAVLIETNGGATTSFGYRILVETKGRWFSGEEVAWL